jgi:hypothetical protein
MMVCECAYEKREREREEREKKGKKKKIFLSLCVFVRSTEVVDNLGAVRPQFERSAEPLDALGELAVRLRQRHAVRVCQICVVLCRVGSHKSDGQD